MDARLQFQVDNLAMAAAEPVILHVEPDDGATWFRVGGRVYIAPGHIAAEAIWFLSPERALLMAAANRGIARFRSV